ncbi:MAG: hypothetical protein LBO62_06410 [Endomicrobium sp.]|nr:hypothetical protein [Endomicrobium sp.]
MNLPYVIDHLEKSVYAASAEGNNEVGMTVIDSDRLLSIYSQKLTTEEYKQFNCEKAEELIFKKLNEIERQYGFKEKKRQRKQRRNRRTGSGKDTAGTNKNHSVKNERRN